MLFFRPLENHFYTKYSGLPRREAACFTLQIADICFIRVLVKLYLVSSSFVFCGDYTLRVPYSMGFVLLFN